MRRRRALALAAALPAAIAGLPGLARARSAVRRSLAFDSPSLGRPMAYSLYLPDGYDPAGPPLSVIYLLHGLGGGETDWLDAGGLRATADRLIAEGALPPAIVVMPDGDDGWYVDAPDGAGRYERAVLVDLPAHVEATLAARTDRAGRAIAGLSMGGFGALRLAMHHPERYVAAASLSGALFPPGTYEDAATADMPPRLFRGAFGTPFDRTRLRRASPFAAIDALAARRAAGEPVPALYLTTGDDDYFGFEKGAMRLYLTLEAAGLPAEIRVTDGDHVWPLWRAELPAALAFLGRALADGPDAAPGRE
ncbi:MAG: alpha/beta hydrolase family protein [Azospirillaceae bacterium]